MPSRGLAGALAAALLGCAGGGGAGWLGALAGGEPSETTLVAGLREALAVGTRNAVAITSREGGYFDDPRLRIGLPRSLGKLAKGLRAVGLGDRVDRDRRRRGSAGGCETAFKGIRT